MDERRTPHVYVDQDACLGCRTCFETCIYGVYRWDKQHNVSDPAYPEECVTCRQCECYCPAQCIRVEKPELVIVDPIYDPLGFND